MKLLHIADLHIGKRVNEFNMLEGQRYILRQILQMAEAEKPEGILIAGDIYDKSQPSAEAVELLDEFLTQLTKVDRQVFLISGNHDSPERLGFGSRLLKKNGLHIASSFDGELQKETLRDAYGAVNIYLLPFIKPAMLRPYFDQPLESYDAAVRMVIGTASIDPGQRNILLAHQFVTSGGRKPERSDSENIWVGGLDQVDGSAFDAFDYVALGHIHRPQRIGRDTMRYAGSLMKYSFSEVRHQKSATLVELGAKNEISVRLLPLVHLHDLREIKGPIDQLLCVGREDREHAEDYIHATLTDEEELYDALGQLRQVYPNLMSMDFENSRRQASDSSQSAALGDVAGKNPLQLFSEFYQLQNNNELSAKQLQVLEGIFEQSRGGKE